MIYLFSSSQVKNLRSSVARGAIACLGDMFATMQRAMEQVMWSERDKLIIIPF